MNRREFLRLAGASVISGASVFSSGCSPLGERNAPSSTSASKTTAGAARFPLRIAPVKLEISPNQTIQTIGYNGSAPGPLLRVKEGQQVSVDVHNDSDVSELVHWHGLYVPSEVDGAMEEGTPMVPPGGSRQYSFIAQPSGTRWYHTHAFAGKDLRRSLYSGQFGFLVVESGRDPGAYDQEVFLALRDWEPFFTSQLVDTDEQNQKWPQPERPAMLDTRPNGFEVGATIYSINDKALGAGEPMRVRAGQRVLMHVLNASATDDVNLALPGHSFNIVGLDGNPVPTSQTVPVLVLAPAERIDAIVEMKQPGVWVFGSTEDSIRAMGMGVVIEYAGQRGTPSWSKPPSSNWDYTVFGTNVATPEPSQRFDLAFEKIPGGHGGFNRWTINGKSWPDTDPLVVKAGQRYKIVLENKSGDDHPIHLHRHTFELTRIGGKTTSGIRKDTVNVLRRQSAEIDFVADDPGLTLFHCHMQLHMDFGFMALMKYA